MQKVGVIRLKYSLLIFSALFYACSTNRKIANKVGNEFKKSTIISKYQVGFALYDKGKKEMIYEKDAAKYFTPASNTKLFTFFAGLKITPDSIPSLRYVERGDSLVFWGTGDPSFLQSQLKGTKAYEFLRNSKKQLFFAPGRYTGNAYGNGWSWDDFNDYYQPEITELPIFDNVVFVNADAQQNLKIQPQHFSTCFVLDTSIVSTVFKVQRELAINTFKYPKIKAPINYKQYIPYKTSTLITVNLLADTLKKQVGVIDMKMPSATKVIYNLKSDSVFKEMLLPSDNFIAEQLLLTYADQLGIEMNATKVIAKIEKDYLSTLPDKPKWVDGSGLSRGNLFTPRSIVKLLELIDQEVNDQERLFSLLPAGGKSGTLKSAYPATNQPFVFGKTGSLSNNHNQSGYVVTKKGKVFIYSFMNNNFVLPTAEIRKEMVRLITYIHERF